jgi:hypothetical protein
MEWLPVQTSMGIGSTTTSYDDDSMKMLKGVVVLSLLAIVALYVPHRCCIAYECVTDAAEFTDIPT